MFSWENWATLLADWRIFASGLGQTVLASVLSLLLALALGTVMGVLGTAPAGPFRRVSRVYVEFFRNTPLVTQLFFYYHGLPRVGINLPVLAVGVLGLGVYTGAFIAEIIRAGIQSIRKGQLEAAYSQGFTYLQAMRYIVLPQTIQVVLPPLTNQFVNLIKNSSALSLIAGYDLMYQADTWSSYNLLYAVTYVTVALLYLSLTLPLAWLTRRLEVRVRRQWGGGVAA
ncbi:MAG TPA: amino acid ABC transporter permease [Firmicutes bacterium]|nr:amino acid ABC transporter permease [Bacillota bacterium]